MLIMMKFPRCIEFVNVLPTANYGYMFDENDRRTRTNAGDVSSDGETDPVHVHDRPPLGKELNRWVQNPTYSVCN